MRYPYLKYCVDVDIHPLFKNFSGNPLVVNMGAGSPLFDQVDLSDQRTFQAWLDQTLESRGLSWGLASYLENREPILSRFPQMREEERWYHLGLDVIVPLDTPLYAPLDAVVQVFH